MLARYPLGLTALALVLALPRLAAAQANPTFNYGKAEEVKEVKAVDWTAIAEAGLVLTTGNSKTTTATAAAKVTRLDADNKLYGEVNMAYARSTILIVSDEDASGTIGPDEIQESTATTANAWLAKLRYDRFLTEFNSLYATAALGADRPAGKDLYGGGQVGYSRLLYKDGDKHQLTGEVGYDFSYEDLAAGDPLQIHSARAFVGYKGKLTEVTAVEASAEVLGNLNSLDTVPETSGPFEDLRVNAGAAITTKLTSKISLNVSLGTKFDNRPAPRAVIGGIPYDAGFVPVADKLDTITKASLIIALF
ncbi:MAG: DUF481 domain-containing protein [Kofleriaceae bacterium]|nr:DUF481 domain-containing protein [Kofleriaceae bacterium]